jgi:hypothetical protein
MEVIDRVKGLWVQLMIEEGLYDGVRSNLINDTSDKAILAVYSSYPSENKHVWKMKFLNVE